MLLAGQGLPAGGVLEPAEQGGRSRQGTVSLGNMEYWKEGGAGQEAWVTAGGAPWPKQFLQRSATPGSSSSSQYIFEQKHVFW